MLTIEDISLDDSSDVRSYVYRLVEQLRLEINKSSEISESTESYDDTLLLGRLNKLKASLASIEEEIDAVTTALQNQINTNASNIATNTANITTLQKSKQDTLTPGNGITISGNTISADIKSTSNDSVKINNIVYYASESDYEDLETKDANTLYLIKES